MYMLTLNIWEIGLELPLFRVHTSDLRKARLYHSNQLCQSSWVDIRVVVWLWAPIDFPGQLTDSEMFRCHGAFNINTPMMAKLRRAVDIWLYCKQEI